MMYRILALALAASVIGQAPDEPITTLKVATRIVEISAVVHTKGGQPETDMAKDDFVLKQDGKEVPIRYFSKGDELPLTLALLVDTSGSQRTFIGDESLASDVFFLTMLERRDDRAMLVQFDTSVRLLQPMTNSRNNLHLALLNLSAHPSAQSGTLLNDAVFAVARDFLATQTGRKAIVILSDGGDNGSRHAIAEAIEQAQRGDVQIYSVLYSLRTGFGPPGPDPGKSTLQSLSDATGGHVFEVSNTLSLREVFAAIAQDLRLQYELGYTPPAGTEPNSYHKLDLKTKDKKLLVQARKGFFANP